MNKKIDFNAIDAMPEGLDQMYLANFRRVFQGEDKTKWERNKAVVGLIVASSASSENVPKEIVRHVLGGSKEALAQATEDISLLFPLREGRFCSIHKSVVDWLTDVQKAGEFFVGKQTVDRGKSSLARHCLARVNRLLGEGRGQGDGTSTGGKLEPGFQGDADADADRYALTNVIQFLVESGGAREAASLLFSFAYILAKAKIGQILALLRDAKTVVVAMSVGEANGVDSSTWGEDHAATRAHKRAAAEESEEGAEMGEVSFRAVELIVSALQLAIADGAQTDWRRLPGQLVARLIGYSKSEEEGERVPAIVRLLAGVRSWKGDRGRKWWCPLSQTFEPAGGALIATFRGHKGKLLDTVLRDSINLTTHD